MAYQLQGYPSNRVLFNALISRLNEAIVGEISLEDAYARMESDITNQLAESGR